MEGFGRVSVDGGHESDRVLGDIVLVDEDVPHEVEIVAFALIGFHSSLYVGVCLDVP